MAGDFPDTNIGDLVMAAVWAHNNQHRKHGYAPVQWAFGQRDDEGTAFDAMGWLDNTGLATREMIRTAAEREYLKVRAADKISKILNTVAKKLHTCEVGTLVYYFRRPKK
eukprot:9080947-Alexandrium_andersonii.AAC.1